MRELGLVVLVLLMGVGATLWAAPEESTPGRLGLGWPGEVEAGGDEAGPLVRSLADPDAPRVRIRAAFFRVRASHAPDVLGEHVPDAEGSARVVPAARAEAWLAALREGAISAEPPPPLVLHDGQRGRVGIAAEHTYIQDYDLEVRQGAAPDAVPLVGRMRDGSALEITPHHREGGIALEIETAWAQVVRPVATFRTELVAVRRDVTLELPELRLMQQADRVQLPPDGGFVLVGRGFAWDGEYLRLVLLEVRPAS